MAGGKHNAQLASREFSAPSGYAVAGVRKYVYNYPKLIRNMTRPKRLSTSLRSWISLGSNFHSSDRNVWTPVNSNEYQVSRIILSI